VCSFRDAEKQKHIHSILLSGLRTFSLVWLHTYCLPLLHLLLDRIYLNMKITSSITNLCWTNSSKPLTRYYQNNKLCIEMEQNAGCDTSSRKRNFSHSLHFSSVLRIFHIILMISISILRNQTLCWCWLSHISYYPMNSKLYVLQI
jgi:hypothetical protein